MRVSSRRFQIGFCFWVLACFFVPAGESAQEIPLQLGPDRGGMLAVRERIGLPVRTSTEMALMPGGNLLVLRREIGEDGPAAVRLIDFSTDPPTIGTLELPQPGSPGGIAVDPQGRRAYIALSKAIGSLTTQGSNRVDVIDLESGAPSFVASVEVLPAGSDFGPARIAVDPSGARVYVTNRGNGRLDIIEADPDTDTYVHSGSVLAQGDPIGIAVAPDGSRVYAANRSTSNIAVFDPNSNPPSLVETIGLSIGPSGSITDLALSPDGSRLYAMFAGVPGSNPQPRIAVIDTLSNSETGLIDLSQTTLPEGQILFRAMALSPDGNTLFALGRKNDFNELFAIDLTAPVPSVIQCVPAGETSVAQDVVSTGAVTYLTHSLELLEVVSTTARLNFAQFGDGAEGMSQILSQSLLINLSSGQPAETFMVIRDNDGRPLNVDLNGLEVAGDSRFDIPPGGLRILDTDGQGPLSVGSVRVGADQPLSGVIQFTGNAGVAGVGNSAVLEGGFLAPMESDSAQAINTGIAVMNLECVNLTLDLQLCDQDGTLLATDSLRLAGSGHLAIFLNEFDWLPEAGVALDFSDFRGILKAVSSGRIAATVLQDRPGEFATLPVARQISQAGPSAALLQNGQQDLFFAQFANGGTEQGQVASQILLLNLNPDTSAAATLHIRDNQGNPLTVNLNGESVAGETQLAIPGGALRVLESDGLGPLIPGSVAVRSDQPLAGVIVFAGLAGAAGVGSSQAVASGFVAPMESNAQASVNTGIAVMNLEAQTVTVGLQLFDPDRSLLATSSFSLPPLGHLPLFLDQFDWIVEPGVALDLDFPDFRGLLQAIPTGSVSATVIQTRPGQLSTMPVAALN